MPIAVQAHKYTLTANTFDSSFPFPFDIPPDSKGWAWYRSKPWWIQPRWLPSMLDLEAYSIHLLLLHTGSEIMAIYPVSGGGLCNLQRDAQGKLKVHLRRGSTEIVNAMLSVARCPAEDLEAAGRLIPECVAKGKKWIGAGSEVPEFSSPRNSPFDGLGTCTWTALGEGTHPTQANLGSLVDDLVEHAIPVQTFIIDDGWQDYRDFPLAGDDRRGLWSFGAAEAMGPEGLAGAVEMIKARLEDVQGVGKCEVGVWVALTGGYWEGIHPESPLVKKYNCVAYPRNNDDWPGIAWPDMPNYTVPPPEDARRFWLDYFKSLHAQGVTFVKVDHQAALFSLAPHEGKKVADINWAAMTLAADETFGPGRVIHCMAHEEATFGGLTGLGFATQGQRYVWRVSDDFNMGGADGHAYQIMTVLLSSMLSSGLCVVPDADMFATAPQDKHPHAHALLRALTPGPVVLSDKPGTHDLALLHTLIAKTKAGTFRPLRAPTAVQPLSRRLFDNVTTGPALWAGTSQTTEHDTRGVLGVWNVTTTGEKVTDSDGAPWSPWILVDAEDDLEEVEEPTGDVEDVLTTTDVEDVLGPAMWDAAWIVASVDALNEGHHVGVEAVLEKGDEGELGRFTLPQGGCRSFWVVSAHTHPRGLVGVLGLVDKLAGVFGVKNVKVDDSQVSVAVTHAGVLGVLYVAPQQPKVTARADGAELHVRVQPLSADKGRGAWLLEMDVGAEASIPTTKKNTWDVAVHIH